MSAKQAHRRLADQAKRGGFEKWIAYWALLAIGLMGGCAHGPPATTPTGALPIDTSQRANTQGPRVDLLIIHYTAEDYETSLRLLTRTGVSSHYLVRDNPPTVLRLVDEDQRASHAGVSGWARRTLLNHSSIGIEIVGRGYVAGPVDPQGPGGPDGRVFVPYPPEQIEVVVKLVREIVQRWGIPKERVIGHADIAPGRKQDPGPLFPWKRLADEGLALWFDEARAAALTPQYEAHLPPPPWFAQRLERLGYHYPFAATAVGATVAPGEGAALKDLLVSFQMRFRPARYDGVADAQTAAILAALTSP